MINEVWNGIPGLWTKDLRRSNKITSLCRLIIAEHSPRKLPKIGHGLHPVGKGSKCSCLDPVIPMYWCQVLLTSSRRSQRHPLLTHPGPVETCRPIYGIRSSWQGNRIGDGRFSVLFVLLQGQRWRTGSEKKMVKLSINLWCFVLAHVLKQRSLLNMLHLSTRIQLLFIIFLAVLNTWGCFYTFRVNEHIYVLHYFLRLW